MQLLDIEAVGHQQRMLVILDDDERVAARVLAGHVPGRIGRARLAADTEPRALPEGVERQAAMLAEAAAFRRLDGPPGILADSGSENPRTAARR